MKKFILIALFVVACFIPFSVHAYSVTVTDPQGDQIGQSGFDSFSIVYTLNQGTAEQITIGTNSPQAGILVSAWQTLPADLLFDWSGNGPGYDYAIPLVNHGGFTAGQVYNITSLSISDDFEPAVGGYTFNHNEPVWLLSGTAIVGATGSWVWNTTGGTNPVYDIVYNNATWSLYDSSVFWATSNCANDTVAGGPSPVPEPATMLLLGLGLIGLAGVRRKFKK